MKTSQPIEAQQCDRHSSARAAARILLANLGELYMCQHCLDAFAKQYHHEYHVTYPVVTV